MSDEEYRLSYRQREDVVFPSQTGMKIYLTREQKIWGPFLGHLRKTLGSPLLTNNGRSQVSADQLANAFETHLDLLPDRAQFNRATTSYESRSILPPPSDSLDGNLILGLFDCGMVAEALAAYIHILAKDQDFRFNVNDEIGDLNQKGKPLVDAAPIVKALPYSRVSTSKMAGAVRAAENHVQALADEIVAAQKANASHELELQAQLDEQKTQAKRVNDLILRLNRRRDNRHKLWVEAINSIVAEKFEDARKKIRLFELKS